MLLFQPIKEYFWNEKCQNRTGKKHGLSKKFPREVTPSFILSYSCQAFSWIDQIELIHRKILKFGSKFLSPLAAIISWMNLIFFPSKRIDDLHLGNLSNPCKVRNLLEFSMKSLNFAKSLSLFREKCWTRKPDYNCLKDVKSAHEKCKALMKYFYNLAWNWGDGEWRIDFWTPTD